VLHGGRNCVDALAVAMSGRAPLQQAFTERQSADGDLPRVAAFGETSPLHFSALLE
jgi:hypothetical protein